MITDSNSSDDLCSGADIDMTTNPREPGWRVTQRNLLEDETVRPDFNVRMDDDSVGMRDEQTSAKS